MCATDMVSVAQRLQLFSSLSTSTLAVLDKNAVTLDFVRGRVVFQEGTEARGLYILLDGQVKIYKISASGRELILNVVKCGAPLFEASVFHGGTIPVSSMTIQDSKILYIDKSTLVSLIVQDASFTLSMLNLLSQSMMQMAMSIGRITLLSVLSRVSSYLLHLANERKSNVFDLDTAKYNIAGFLGVSREALSRALSKLVCNNIITMRKRTITVVDFERLATIADGARRAT